MDEAPIPNPVITPISQLNTIVNTDKPIILRPTTASPITAPPANATSSALESPPSLAAIEVLQL